MKNDNEIEEFQRKYKENMKMYEAWGKQVSQVICDHLKAQGYDDKTFLKVPVEPRVKDIESITNKAFVRKHYDNPLEDITDKVGIRFVVLITSQIDVIVNIIKSQTDWKFSEDRDYKQEQEEKPELFTYQSVHLIVRNKDNIVYNGQTIIKDTPCEVQIRTLEQHAYAEISHDIVYKKGDYIDKSIKRYLARSMALNEATDELFERVYAMSKQQNELYCQFTSAFMELCEFSRQNSMSNKSIYEMVEPLVIEKKITVDQVVSFLDQKPFIIEYVKENQKLNLIYQQPMVFLLYYLIKNFDMQFRECWDLTDDFIAPIYSNLGIAFQ